jgi:phospholipid transport system substrate-binding protein
MPRTLIVAAMMTLALGLPARAWATTATEALRRYTDQVLRILQDSTLSPAARRVAVRDVADEAFDVRETARRTLGRHWHERTSAEQEEFVRVFQDLLERTFIPWVDEYRGEQVRYVSERLEGERAAVRAMIVTRLGIEIPVESRLLRTADRWHVYDVLVESVSLVANYRSQFDRVIRTGSYGELVNRLKAQVERLADTPPRAPDDPSRR